MTTRLTSLSPDLEAAIASAVPEMQKLAISELMSWLYREVPQQEEKLRFALINGRIEEAKKVLHQLDEEYFSLQEQDQPEEALRSFSQARAASATVYAIRGELTEATYEAINATDNLAGAANVILSALRGSA